MIIKISSRLLIITFTSSFLWACGGGEQSDGAATDSQASGSEQAANATPQQASSGKSKRDCPAKPTSSPRAEGSPVDDIVGVRNGMSLDDVVWILECRDDIGDVETAEKWNIKQTYGFPIRQLVRGTNGTECTSQEMIKEMGTYGGSKKCSDGGYRFKPKKDITHQIAVAFLGMPGEEKVGAVWRRNVFAEGSYPAKDAIMESITDKYGEPHLQQPGRNGAMVWAFDPNLNRPLSKASQEYNACTGYASSNFEGSHVWRSNCGVTIAVGITPVYGNDLLVSELNIGIMDQKSLYEMSEAFNTALAAAAEQKKLDEAAAAASNASTPDL